MLFAKEVLIPSLAPAQGISLVFLTTLRDSQLMCTVYVVGTRRKPQCKPRDGCLAKAIPPQTAKPDGSLYLLVYKPGRVLPRFSVFSALYRADTSVRYKDILLEGLGPCFNHCRSGHTQVSACYQCGCPYKLGN